MESDQRLPQAPGSTADRRRGSRFPVIVPVRVKWQGPAGGIVQEDAQAHEVNVYGGLLFMYTSPVAGGEVELTNLITSEVAKGRAVAIRRPKQGAVLEVAVELTFPSETFWGLTFRLRKSSTDLLRIERDIKAGGIDPRVLREFRDAVDYVRKTAWAVQEWQERQLRQRDAHTLLPLLTVERIRRVTQLSMALAEDLDAHDVTADTLGVTELYQALDRVHQRISTLLNLRAKS